MKAFIHPSCLAVFLLLQIVGNGFANDELKEQYRQRIESASSQLNETREAILKEKKPLHEALRMIEDEVLDSKREIQRLETQKSEFEASIAALEASNKSILQSLDYSVMLSKELLGVLSATTPVGAAQSDIESIDFLSFQINTIESIERFPVSLQIFRDALNRSLLQLGGHRSQGTAIFEGETEVKTGRFVQIGPQSYFRDDASGHIGLAIQRENEALPVANRVSAPEGREVFENQLGYLPLDATGGKAIEIERSKGTWVDTLHKAGSVGYVIVGLGVFAFLTALTKLWDLRLLSVDAPQRVQSEIDRFTKSAGNDVEPQLKGTCKQLFEIGLRHKEKPKELLEEVLFAFVLLQRNLHERRLPLLKVIAAAAPLLGLLGTVVGMIKTFTLITIYGTGNAAKLSSGISEALLTTELGLIVAIPTLVVYGFLSHQTERRLSLLEQYSMEFVNAFNWLGSESNPKR